MVDVPLHELTDRQVHLHLINLFEEQVNFNRYIFESLNRMENFMSDLTNSVAQLQEAVDGVASRWNAQLVPLTEALAAAQAAADESNQELQQALSDAQSAAGEIGNQVGELNQLGADPSSPVAPVEEQPTEPAPVDETPAPEEEPAAPVDEPAAPVEETPAADSSSNSSVEGL